jgi:hypothetical protein
VTQRELRKSQKKFVCFGLTDYLELMLLCTATNEKQGARLFGNFFSKKWTF